MTKNRIRVLSNHYKHQSGKKAVEILQKIADNGRAGIDDPVAWQQRQYNPLLGRE